MSAVVARARMYRGRHGRPFPPRAASDFSDPVGEHEVCPVAGDSWTARVAIAEKDQGGHCSSACVDRSIRTEAYPGTMPAPA